MGADEDFDEEVGDAPPEDEGWEDEEAAPEDAAPEEDAPLEDVPLEDEEAPWEDEEEEKEAPLEDVPFDEEVPLEDEEGDEEAVKLPCEAVSYSRDRDGKYCVRMRQQLRNRPLAKAFIREFGKFVDKESANDTVVRFDDFDISQNPIPVDLLEEIFTLLSNPNVHIERLRAFGLPTFNDEACKHLADWLSVVEHKVAPSEMHLSDCAITEEGFELIAEALESNEAFPPADPKRPRGDSKLPLYLRLEHNYIDVAAIEAHVESGTFLAMKKTDPIGNLYKSEAKCRLLVVSKGDYQQKEGPPPAPENAPPPKKVSIKGKGKDKGKGGKSGKDSGKSGRDSGKSGWDSGRTSDRRDVYDRKGWDDWHRDSWNRDSWNRDDRRWDDRGSQSRNYYHEGKGGRDREPPWSRGQQALPAPDRGSARGPPPSGRGERDRERSRERDRPASRGYGDRGGSRDRDRGSGRPAPFSAFGDRSRGGPPPPRAGDRHSRGPPPPPRLRSPTGRSPRRERSKDRAPSSRAPNKRSPEGDRDRGRGEVKRPRESSSRGTGTISSSKGSKSAPPAPWEVHWSPEYKLNYYWNAKTGESSWTKPEA